MLSADGGIKGKLKRILRMGEEKTAREKDCEENRYFKKKGIEEEGNKEK